MAVKRASDAVPVLLLVALAAAQLWPGLSAGLAPPISWDHGAHLGKAMVTASQLLPSLRGWTDLTEAGVPLNTLYTPIGTMLILCVRALTFPLEWTQTYALTLVVFRVFVGLSVYRLARVAGAGRVGALAGGVMALADFGDHSEGGWFYDVVFGVWPMSLAMCVFFLGLADLLAYLERRERVVGARAMILLGVALFGHQMSLLATCTVLPAVLVVRAAEMPASFRRDLGAIVGVLAVMVAIASWWLLPMLGASHLLDDHGQLYQGAADVGARFVRGEAVLRAGVWTGALVALGLVAGVFARGNRRVLAIGVLLATLISTSSWLISLDMVRWLPPLGRIMYPRFMMIAKPMSFALVGCLLGDVVKLAAPALRRMRSAKREALPLIAALALALPLALGAWEPLRELLVTRDVTTTASLGEWQTWNEVWRWVRERPRSEGFFRVAYVDDTTHVETLSGAMTGRPFHTPDLLVAEAFGNTTDSLDPQALLAMNVRYVVAFRGLPGELRAHASEVTTLGAATVWELREWSPRVVIDADGDARPRLLALERARLAFAPEGARSVVVRRASAPWWHAYADGEEIPIEGEAVRDGNRFRLMRLALPEGTQRVELVYQQTRAIDVLGLLLTLLGLAFGFAFAAPASGAWLRERGQALGAALSERVPSWLVRGWPAWIVGAPIVLLLAAMARNARGHHFAYDDSLRVSLMEPSGAETACDLEASVGHGVRCGSQPDVEVFRRAVPVAGRFHSCLTTPAPRGAALVLRWDEAPLRGRLLLGAGVSDEVQARGRGAPVEVRVFIDDELSQSLSVPNGRAWIDEEVQTPSGTHALRIEIESREPGRRAACVDVIAR